MIFSPKTLTQSYIRNQIPSIRIRQRLNLLFENEQRILQCVPVILDRRRVDLASPQRLEHLRVAALDFPERLVIQLQDRRERDLLDEFREVVCE